jgi:hypothetical protein
VKVWLDDERPAPAGWVHARTFEEAIWLSAEAEEMSLDHDLGEYDADGRELTGYDVLLFIEQLCRDEFGNWNGWRPPRLHVHSANPPARQRMEAAIRAIEGAA